MVRFLLLLTWLLLSLTKANNVQAACYAGTWTNGLPVYSSLFVDGGTTLAQCQAVACQAYPGISTSCPSACQVETQTQTKTCPANYTGQVTESRTKTCPDNTWQPWTVIQNTCTPNPVTCTYQAQVETRSCAVNYSGAQTWKKETNCPSGSYGQPVQSEWFKIQDTCVQNPPTCQISSQQQTLSCQTGYTGSITQTRSSTCPDPYGSPAWQPWVTTSDTCKKSVNNPTNPVSPVNPSSPVSRPSNMSAPTTPSLPAIAPTPMNAPNSEMTPMAPPPPKKREETETKSAPNQEKSATKEAAPTSASETKTDSQTTSTTQASPSPPPKGKTQSVVGLVLSLELFVKPGLQQPNMFFEPQLVSGIPNAILMQDSIMMNLLQQTGFNQPEYNQDLGFEQ